VLLLVTGRCYTHIKLNVNDTMKKTKPGVRPNLFMFCVTRDGSLSSLGKNFVARFRVPSIFSVVCVASWLMVKNLLPSIHGPSLETYNKMRTNLVSPTCAMMNTWSHGQDLNLTLARVVSVITTPVSTHNYVRFYKKKLVITTLIYA
jgi:hypothetical protein